MHIVRNCTPKDIESAARTLIEGKLIAFPTETVYGLGADAENSEAVKKIYEIKGRPSNHPLIVHISSLDLMEYWATNIPDYAWKLAKKFWPGPLTLILKRSNNAKNFITGNQDTVGLRIPNHPIALKLLRKYEELGGKGVSAPSANRFGAVSPTSAEDVFEELSMFDCHNVAILDGGKCKIGIESTILDLFSPEKKVLRPGAIVLKNPKSSKKQKDIDLINFPRVSGNFTKHYAPKSQVKINEIPKRGEGLIALNFIPTPENAVRLASPINCFHFANQFYSALRLADYLNLTAVCIFLPKKGDLAEAIKDRALQASRGKV